MIEKSSCKPVADTLETVVALKMSFSGPYLVNSAEIYLGTLTIHSSLRIGRAIPKIGLIY